MARKGKVNWESEVYDHSGLGGRNLQKEQRYDDALGLISEQHIWITSLP